VFKCESVLIILLQIYCCASESDQYFNAINGKYLVSK